MSGHELHSEGGRGGDVASVLAGLVGRHEGGCEDCDAHQTVEDDGQGGFVNRIYHDDDCPIWLRHQNRAARRAAVRRAKRGRR